MTAFVCKLCLHQINSKTEKRLQHMVIDPVEMTICTTCTICSGFDKPIAAFDSFWTASNCKEII